jgi:hypothetical protein
MLSKSNPPYEPRADHTRDPRVHTVGVAHPRARSAELRSQHPGLDQPQNPAESGSPPTASG